MALVLIGLGLAMIGGGLSSFADRGEISRLVAEDVIESTVLSDELLTEIVFNASFWGGIGFVATGVLAIGAGVLFGLHRLRGDPAVAPGPDAISNALVGAVVSVITISIPFSVVLGGLAAGFLQQRSPWAGFRVGLVAGLFVAIPVLFILGATIAGVVVSGLLFVGLLMIFGLVFSLTYTVLLSGVGGYVGGYLATRQ